MMVNPLFRNYCAEPSRPRCSPSVPVYRKATAATSSKPSPKVVSIPVHFVRSEASRSESALRIQKVFRGFQVRRSLKRIMSLKREVEEVELKISRAETVDALRRDAKERLRLNETLMALLLKLDSVRGIDPGVRDCRKAVIKKAIALQERIDAIVATGEQTLEISDSTVCTWNSADEAVGEETTAPSAENPGDDSTDNQAQEDAIADFGNCVVQMAELDVEASCSEDLIIEQICSQKSLDASGSESLESHSLAAEVEDGLIKTDAADDGVDSAPRASEEMEVTEVGVDCEAKDQEEACVVKRVVEILPVTEWAEDSVEKGPTEDTAVLKSSVGREGHVSNRDEDDMKIKHTQQKESDVKGCVCAAGREYKKRDNEPLEKMMVENEKMMNMMAQLFERNEVQMQMLSSLTQRVEQLERAFVCDRLRKKKKRNVQLGQSVAQN